MKTLRMVCGLCFLAGGGLFLSGQDAEAEEAKGGYVTKEEYDKLRQQVEALQKQLDALKKGGAGAAAAAASEEDVQGLEEEISEVRRIAESAKPGNSHFLITGYAFGGYTEKQNEDSFFNAGFNPIFLWKLGERVLFEGELEVELEEGATEVALEYAQLTYLLNDYVTLGGGKFLLPFGIFSERLHPAWINKLPDAPLAWGHDGFVPAADVGVQIRGGTEVAANAKVNYSFFVINGPQLAVAAEEEEMEEEEGEAEGEGHEEAEGIPTFGSGDDNNNNKAIGGRFGLLPIPELEVGFSVLYGGVGDENDAMLSSVDALYLGTDLSYVRGSDALRGTVDVRFEWARMRLDSTEALLEGARNVQDAFYAQLAYRPDKIDSFAKDFECVFRYDALDVPMDEEDEERYTIGLNYWFNASTVVKLAYQFDDREENEEESDALLIQFAIGF